MAFTTEKKVTDWGLSKAIILPIEQARNLDEVGVVILDMREKDERQLFYKFKEDILDRELS